MNEHAYQPLPASYPTKAAAQQILTKLTRPRLNLLWRNTIGEYLEVSPHVYCFRPGEITPRRVIVTKRLDREASKYVWGFTLLNFFDPGTPDAPPAKERIVIETDVGMGGRSMRFVPLEDQP